MRFRVYRACAATLVAAAIGVLSLAPAAQAQTFTTDCIQLPNFLNGTAVNDGDVVQLSGTCTNKSFTITNTHAFTLQGDGNAATGFNGAAASSSILSSNQPVQLTIKNLSFSNGTQTPSQGGAISIQNPGAAPTIVGDTFIGNHAPSGGGAIYVYTGATTATRPTVFDGDVFRNNAGAWGGAITYAGSGAVTLTNSIFTGNHATAQDAGAVQIANGYASSTSPITMSGNSFGGTGATDGNGAVLYGGAADITAWGQPMFVAGNSFIDDTVTGTSGGDDRVGGGLAIITYQGAGTLTQSDNLFSGNLITTSTTATSPSPGAGGGGEWIRGINGSSLRDRFIGNRVATTGGEAPEGGGLGIEGASASLPAVLTATNDVFLGNSLKAGGAGGAIYSGYLTSCTQPDCPSHLTLNNTTIVGNSVDTGAGSQGGAIWGSPDDLLAANNSIIYNNSSASPPGQPDVYGFTSPTYQYSLACAAFNAAGPMPGPGNICAPPSLNADGSETASSPTIDSGSNALVPSGVTTDAFGNPRIARARCADAAIVDMGAFEFPAASCPPSGNPTPLPTSTQGTPSIGSVTTTFNSVTVNVGCTGAPSQICDGAGTLFTTEHLKGPKIVTISAKRKRKRTRQVVVGAKRYTLHGGQATKLVVPLNSTGKALLRRFGKLPVRLVVTIDTAKGKLTITTRHLTIKLKPKHRKRKH